MCQPPGTQLELFNKKTLPLIPPTTTLKTVPVAPAPRPQRTEIHEFGEEIDCDDDDGPPNTLADDAQRMLALYNRYLGLIRGSEEASQQWRSEEFVEHGRNVNMIAERAVAEIQEQLESMHRILGHMFERFRLDEAALRSGNWAYLDIAELRQKLQSCRVTDADHIVDLLRQSFARARKVDQDYGFMTKVDIIAEHLNSLQEGRQDAALELCLVLKTSGVLVYDKITGRSVCGSPISDLHRTIFSLLGLYTSEKHGPYQNFTAIHCPLETDLAAIKRRLCVSVEEHGCHDMTLGDLDTHNVGGKNRLAECVCQRRASLELLHFLQIAAYSQIRAKVYMTVGRLVPPKVCEMIWEYAMAAEEIPLDPRVSLPRKTVPSSRIFTRPRLFQHMFKHEYRCPKFRGFVGDRGRRHGEDEEKKEAEKDAQSGVKNVWSTNSAGSTNLFQLAFGAGNGDGALG